MERLFDYADDSWFQIPSGWVLAIVGYSGEFEKLQRRVREGVLASVRDGQ